MQVGTPITQNLFQGAKMMQNVNRKDVQEIK